MIITLTENQKKIIEQKLNTIAQMRSQLELQENSLIDLINFNSIEPVVNVKSIRVDNMDLIVE